MGANGSVPQVRAKDVKRVCEGRHGWLNKAGLTNTKMQKRWCAIHDLRLYYYESSRDAEPKGVVALRGAIVTISKRIKNAIEIETGSLITEKGVEKRVYFFTPVDGVASIGNEAALREQNMKAKKLVNQWYTWLQEEAAKTFTPL
mmetsp:Transcript_43185/g.104189  ORF Transcript_43185/g.104189 Transcript_43185/m.104189 type:complete len:145 (-) Transcript_43185:16-450(-)